MDERPKTPTHDTNEENYSSGPAGSEQGLPASSTLPSDTRSPQNVMRDAFLLFDYLGDLLKQQTTRDPLTEIKNQTLDTHEEGSSPSQPTSESGAASRSSIPPRPTRDVSLEPQNEISVKNTVSTPRRELVIDVKTPNPETFHQTSEARVLPPKKKWAKYVASTSAGEYLVKLETPTRETGPSKISKTPFLLTSDDIVLPPKKRKTAKYTGVTSTAEPLVNTETPTRESLGGNPSTSTPTTDPGPSRRNDTTPCVENRPSTSKEPSLAVMKNTRKRSAESSMLDDISERMRHATQYWQKENLVPLSQQFPDCPFVTEDGKFKVPGKVEKEQEEELKNSLLKVYEESNLPSVPEAVRNDSVAIRHYPLMKVYMSARLTFPFEDIILEPKCFAMAFKNTDQPCIIYEDHYASDKGPSGTRFHCLLCLEEDKEKKYFKEKSKINRHIRSHFPQKKFICGVCGILIDNKSDMNRHLSTHTDVKPHQCPICGKEFAQKVSLDTHMSSHKNANN